MISLLKFFFISLSSKTSLKLVTQDKHPSRQPKRSFDTPPPPPDGHSYTQPPPQHYTHIHTEFTVCTRLNHRSSDSPTTVIKSFDQTLRVSWRVCFVGGVAMISQQEGHWVLLYPEVQLVPFLSSQNPAKDASQAFKLNYFLSKQDFRNVCRLKLIIYCQSKLPSSLMSSANFWATG